jgi:hypothetical protein
MSNDASILSDDVSKNTLQTSSPVSIVSLYQRNGMWGEPMWGSSDVLGGTLSFTYESNKGKNISLHDVSMNVMEI